MPDQDLRDYLERRRADGKRERASFDAHWKELGEYYLPRRTRFFVGDANKGDKRHQSIINSHGTQALQIARGGLLAGVMSWAQPWFALETPDPDMMEFQPVRIWLSKMERLLNAIFADGNLYDMAPLLIGDVLLFATGAMSHLDDFESVARFYTHAVGSYWLAQNDRYVVDTFGRDFQMTTRQMVAKFGLANVSKLVRDQWDKGEYDQWHEVRQIVEPNPDFDPGKALARFLPFREFRYEPAGGERDKYLSRTGFHEFPVYAPRWDVTAEDVYGTDCPAITSLGDVKGLQTKEKILAQAIEKMANPPLKGPPLGQHRQASALPGGYNVYDPSAAGSAGPLYTVDPKVQELGADIARTERRIDTSFFVDLFLAISTMEGIQPRNQLELAKRDAERLLQLGPVLGRMFSDFLNLMIDRTFNQTARAGIMPTPPPELRGQSLKVRYISTLAIAQRAAATRTVSELFAFGSSLAELWPGVTDKLDADQAVDEYSLALSAPPRLVVPDDVVAERRAERQRLEMAQRELEMAQAGANVAKMASDAKLGDDSVLSRMAQ